MMCLSIASGEAFSRRELKLDQGQDRATLDRALSNADLFSRSNARTKINSGWVKASVCRCLVTRSSAPRGAAVLRQSR